MTTGEKLAKLRREKQYTQEQLADILNVSRQSISKWETDLAYPETAKLIELSKLYGCTLDYLLSSEQNERKTDETKTPSTKGSISYKLFSLIWGSSYFILMLLFYAFNYLKIEIDLNLGGGLFPFPNQSTFINVSVFDLLANGPSEIGNIIVLFAFLTTLGLLTISILTYFIEDLSKLLKTRKILAIIEVSLWILMALLFIGNIQIAAILIPILSMSHLFGLIKIKPLRFIQ